MARRSALPGNTVAMAMVYDRIDVLDAKNLKRRKEIETLVADGATKNAWEIGVLRGKITAGYQEAAFLTRLLSAMDGSR